jgi:hypothetical protein
VEYFELARPRYRAFCFARWISNQTIFGALSAIEQTLPFFPAFPNALEYQGAPGVRLPLSGHFSRVDAPISHGCSQNRAPEGGLCFTVVPWLREFAVLGPGDPPVPLMVLPFESVDPAVPPAPAAPPVDVAPELCARAQEQATPN